MDIQSCNFLAVNGVKAEFDFIIFIIMLVLVVLSAFFSMSETAFSSSSDSKLKLAIDEKKPGAKKAIYLYEHFDRTLTTLLIGNNLVNVALSTMAVTFFTRLAINKDWVDLVSTLSITLVLLIFGEIVPKMVAKMNPEGVALKVSFIIYVLSYVLYPFVLLFVGLQRLLSNKKEVHKTKDELGVIIDELEDTGVIEKDEAEVIHNVLDLGDRSVEDIMVPRIKMEALDYNSTLDEVKAFMIDNPYSRIPVYKKDKDHIVGILYERDFFPALVKNPKMSWKRLLRPVKFVSSAMKIDALIEDLQSTKTHIAIVSGEWGDVLGLVTMEDALEELVGEIYDEHDIQSGNDNKFEKQDDGSYIVDADMYVEDLFEALNIGDVPEDIPSKLSGWLFAKCESLPVEGYKIDYLARYTKQNEESDEYEDFNKIVTLSIYEVKNRAITLVKVTLRDATEEEIEAMEEKEEE
ncbi:MAG: hemolysin family protein [Anaeroplasma sp.]